MTLKEKAESHLGEPISEEEYQSALPLAVNKLSRINDRYGTDHGEDYLAMLIYEQVLFTRFSNFCNANHRVMQAEKKTNALQREASAHLTNNYTPRGIICQEV